MRSISRVAGDAHDGEAVAPGLERAHASSARGLVERTVRIGGVDAQLERDRFAGRQAQAAGDAIAGDHLLAGSDERHRRRERQLRVTIGEPRRAVLDARLDRALPAAACRRWPRAGPRSRRRRPSRSRSSPRGARGWRRAAWRAGGRARRRRAGAGRGCDAERRARRLSPRPSTRRCRRRRTRCSSGWTKTNASRSGRGRDHSHIHGSLPSISRRSFDRCRVSRT